MKNSKLSWAKFCDYTSVSSNLQSEKDEKYFHYCYENFSGVLGMAVLAGHVDEHPGTILKALARSFRRSWFRGSYKLF